MARKVQGTHLFFIDPDSGEVVRIVCVTSIDGLSAPIAQIETTCLEDTARRYEPGLEESGTMTFGLNWDPQDATHLRIAELFRNKSKNVQFAIGYEGSNSVPTVDTADHFDFPTDRDFDYFEGYFSDVPRTFALNDVVKSTIGVQLSGPVEISPATT